MTKGLLIFDLDGVLVRAGMDHSMPAQILDGLVKTPSSETGLIKLPSTDWISALEKFGIDPKDYEKIDIISKRLFAWRKKKDTLYPWVPEVIPQLAVAKKLAILTNNSLVTVNHHLAELTKFFSIIKTWENVAKLKPSGKGLRSILQESNMDAASCLVIGDNEDDLQAGRKNGVETILVNWEDTSLCQPSFPSGLFSITEPHQLLLI